MAIQVTHSKVSNVADGSNTDVIRPSDWNAYHVINGIPDLYNLINGKIRIPVLIQSQTPSGVNNVTFSGLNGDSDGEYLFEYDLVISTTADSYLQIEPNGLTSNQKFTRLYSSNYNGTSDQGTSVGSSYMLLAQSGWNKNCLVSGNMTFKAASGQNRRAYGTGSLICTDFSEMGMGIIGNYWGDTTTNITSFVLALTGSATMTGTINLYKMKTIDLTAPS